jgi:tRNA dimethylallyltransferase
MAKDPATRIHPNDHYRIVRALQAMELSGLSWSELNAEARKAEPRYPGMRYFCLQWPMEELEERIRLRVKAMLRDGLEKEVRALLERGVPFDAKPMRSVGYKETAEAIRAGSNDAALEAAIVTATRRLAKQQMTWFRGERSVEWLQGDFLSQLKVSLCL